MAKTWAISGVDLHVELAGNRVRAGLETALREALQTGRLAPGTRLPSSRALAVVNWSHIEDGQITRIRVTFDPRPLLG